MTGGGWMTRAKQIPLAQVAAELGIAATRNRLERCVACGTDRRSSSDRRRYPVSTHGAGRWTCHTCQASGSAVDLVAHVVGGLGEARGWFAARGWVEPAPGQAPPPRVTVRPPPAPPPSRHPSAEVIRARWDALPRELDPESLAWLRFRGIDPERVFERDLARGHGTRAGYRLVLRGYVGADHVTLRERWTGTEAPPKGTPKERALADAPSGVALLCPTAHSLVRGEPWAQDLGLLYVTEGTPDWLTRATAMDAAEAYPVVGVLGATAWPAWLQVPDGWTVIVDAHQDAPGAALVDRVVKALPNCRIKRTRYA